MKRQLLSGTAKSVFAEIDENKLEELLGVLNDESLAKRDLPLSFDPDDPALKQQLIVCLLMYWDKGHKYGDLIKRMDSLFGFPWRDCLKATDAELIEFARRCCEDEGPSGNA